MLMLGKTCDELGENQHKEIYPRNLLSPLLQFTTATKTTIIPGFDKEVSQGNLP